MKLVLELPDIAFHVAKSPEQLLREARQALAMFWLARGEIPPERAAEMTAEAAAPTARDFKAALSAMPDVGEDQDFDQRSAPPRSEIQWDT